MNSIMLLYYNNMMLFIGGGGGNAFCLVFPAHSGAVLFVTGRYIVVEMPLEIS